MFLLFHLMSFVFFSGPRYLLNLGRTDLISFRPDSSTSETRDTPKSVKNQNSRKSPKFHFVKY